MATNENLPPNVIKQLLKELKSLDDTPPEGIKVNVNEDDFSTIFADIEGPAGTPYENGLFRMKLILAHDFPRSPPKADVAWMREGRVDLIPLSASLEWLNNAWMREDRVDLIPLLAPGYLCSKVVRCLLIEPFPESALNEQAGKMLIENYEEYAKHARIYTGIHAKPKLKAKSAGISESTIALNSGQPNSASMSTDQDKSTPTAMPVASTTTTSSVPTPLLKKDNPGQVKNAADKKKVDARKKSLRRL